MADDLSELVARIRPLDDAAMGATFDRTPGGQALGKLGGLAVWLSGVQVQSPPRPLVRKRVVLLAADHAPDGDAAVRVRDVLGGGAPVARLARLANAEVRVVDIGVAGDLSADAPAAALQHKVSSVAGLFSRESAASVADVLAALRADAAIADDEADGGTDLLVAAELGGGATAAAAIVCATTGTEPVDAVPRGAAWAPSVAAVRDGLRRAKASSLGPVDLLAELGGVGIAAMTGLLLGAAARRVPMVLDGVVPAAALLVAAQLAPQVLGYVVAGHRSTHPGHRVALEQLGLEPLLDVGAAAGEGCGALLALPLLDAATALSATPA